MRAQISSATLKELRDDIDPSLTRCFDFDGWTAPGGFGRAEAGQHHRERADPTTGAQKHELVRIVERVVQRALVVRCDSAFNPARALQTRDAAARMLDHELAYAPLAPAARAQRLGML